ncbi:MAG: hypothetical protein AAFN40_27055 [Cyanobacteria bacterium J06560_6]
MSLDWDTVGRKLMPGGREAVPHGRELMLGGGETVPGGRELMLGGRGMVLGGGETVPDEWGRSHSSRERLRYGRRA